MPVSLSTCRHIGNPVALFFVGNYMSLSLELLSISSVAVKQCRFEQFADNNV